MADKRVRPGSVSGVEAVALAACIVWLALAGWAFLGPNSEALRLRLTGPLDAVLVLSAIVLPLVLLWMVAAAARTARTLREEGDRVQSALDSMRQSFAQSESAAAALRQEIEAQVAEVALAQASLDAQMAALSATIPDPEPLPTPDRPAPPETQEVLALGPEDAIEPQPLPPEDFIRALNFPENERDQDGFRVLRAALSHPPTADLVRSAQDVLTLMSQEGIYMDDLTPVPAPPSVWRAFAEGIRGPAIARLAGIQDRSSVALTSGRMKDDPVFRDAIHQFLRTFDRVFSAFAATATDVELIRFAETRSARAFMLAGKAAGSFG